MNAGRYFLIMLAMAWCLCAFTAEDEGPFVAFLRVQAQAVLADVTLRRLLMAIGVLLIACMVWQLVGLDLAFVFGGEVITYIEIAAAVFLAAARTRIRRIR